MTPPPPRNRRLDIASARAAGPFLAIELAGAAGDIGTILDLGGPSATIGQLGLDHLVQDRFLTGTSKMASGRSAWTLYHPEY
jgi:hypothetical protein